MTAIGVVANLEFSSAAKRNEWRSVACSAASNVKTTLRGLIEAKLPVFEISENESGWRLDAIVPRAMWTTVSPALTAVVRAAKGYAQGFLQAFDYLRVPTDKEAFEGLVVDVDAEGVRERVPNRRDQRRGIELSIGLEVRGGAEYEDTIFERRTEYRVQAFLAMVPSTLRRDRAAPSLREHMKRSGDEWIRFAKDRGFTLEFGVTLPPQFIYLADRMEDVYIQVRTQEWGSWELLDPTAAKERMAFIEECAKNMPDPFQRFVGMLPLFGSDLDSLLLDDCGVIHLCSRTEDFCRSPFAGDFVELLEKLVVSCADEIDDDL
jgi:hypothetical protein